MWTANEENGVGRELDFLVGIEIPLPAGIGVEEALPWCELTLNMNHSENLFGIRLPKPIHPNYGQ